MKIQSDKTCIYLLDLHTLSDQDSADFLVCLGDGEMQRYKRFIRPERQRQFLAGRILLRQALSRLLGLAITEVELMEQAGKAPQLHKPDLPEVGFSLSHSGPWVACAVSVDSKLGLDIEMLNPERDFAALALQAFGADESVCLDGLDASQRMYKFYQLWTSKEAQFKLNEPVAQYMHFSHPELAITLCSASRLEPAPQLVLTSLSAK